MSLPPRVHLLDPRPANVAAAEPWAAAVNLPADELGARSHELPPPACGLDVGEGEGADAAVAWLEARGRTVRRVAANPGPSGPARLWSPDPFLEAVAAELPGSLAWDLGCGSGRDAVFLAALGWRVRAIDHLPDALARGDDLRGRTLGARATEPRFLRVDLRSGPDALSEPESPHLIVCIRARPAALPTWTARLAPGGSLVAVGFAPDHPLSPPATTLNPEALTGLEIQREARWTDGDRTLVGVVARVPAR